jgi:hypothetical protein
MLFVAHVSFDNFPVDEFAVESVETHPEIFLGRNDGFGRHQLQLITAGSFQMAWSGVANIPKAFKRNSIL